MRARMFILIEAGVRIKPEEDPALTRNTGRDRFYLLVRSNSLTTCSVRSMASLL